MITVNLSATIVDIRKLNPGDFFVHEQVYLFHKIEEIGLPRMTFFYVLVVSPLGDNKAKELVFESPVLVARLDKPQYSMS